MGLKKPVIQVILRQPNTTNWRSDREYPAEPLNILRSLMTGELCEEFNLRHKKQTT